MASRMERGDRRSARSLPAGPTLAPPHPPRCSPAYWVPICPPAFLLACLPVHHLRHPLRDSFTCSTILRSPSLVIGALLGLGHGSQQQAQLLPPKAGIWGDGGVTEMKITPDEGVMARRVKTGRHKPAPCPPHPTAPATSQSAQPPPGPVPRVLLHQRPLLRTVLVTQVPNGKNHWYTC